MKEENWTRWIVQTARSWNDISEVIKQTGIEKIDNDHKILIESALELNRLIEAFESDNVNLAMIKKEAAFLEKVYNIWNKHLQREEALIKKFGLKNLGKQKDQHRKFLTLLDTFINDFKSGRLWVSVNLKMSVLEWVVNHINTIDYETFCLDNWMPIVVENATTWEDVTDLINSTTLHMLDDQHKDLIDLTLTINPLIDRWDSGEKTVINSEDGAALIKRIEQYAVSHFQHEEEFIAKNGIAGIERQKFEHEKFVDSLLLLEKKTLAGEELNPRQIKIDIMVWWIEHINKIDMDTFKLESWTGVFLSDTDSWANLADIVRTTGVDKLDEEHKELILLTLKFNKIIDEVAQTEITQELRDAGLLILDELYQFSKNHFEGEIEFIKKNNIPGLAKQETAHKYFLDMLLEMQEDIRSKRIVFSPRIKSKIIGWWNDHINYTDYETFKLENWAEGLFKSATKFEEVAPIIKQIKIDPFDDDHKDLVVLTFNLCELLSNNTNATTYNISKILVDIHGLSVAHFHREEAYMTKNEIVGREAHQDKHKTFLADLQNYIKKPESLNSDDGENFKLWMFNWWIDHINEVDYHTFRVDANV
ncbi:MAG: hemerythrin family protein [Magnetococcales bacterium]|nr:hemerythrin family protein [Magnetococcales bacterium]